MKSNRHLCLTILVGIACLFVIFAIDACKKYDNLGRNYNEENFDPFEACISVSQVSLYADLSCAFLNVGTDLPTKSGPSDSAAVVSLRSLLDFSSVETLDFKDVSYKQYAFFQNTEDLFAVSPNMSIIG